MKILSIGNSFSEDAHAFLYRIATALGEKDFINANLYIGGCSVERHYKNAVGDLNEYVFNVFESPQKVSRENYSVIKGLKYADWDFVTLQQASRLSGVKKSYDAMQLNFLIALIKKYCPRVKICWHATWAYQKDFNSEQFARYKKNQNKMYRKINSAVKKRILPDDSFSFIIPNTAAIQNARAYLGDTLTRDGYHLSLDAGRFIAALNFYRTLSQNSVADIVNHAKEFEEIPPEIIETAVKCVENWSAPDF